MTQQTNYTEIANSLAKLLNEKQKAYGDAFGSMEEVFKILYPDGIQPYQYSDLLTVVRMLDKVFRIANMPPEGKDVMGEEPYKDIAGYALLALEREARKNVMSL
tara:strand:- start:1399 stop:1710 length:312 start_codon:yes stop_codon:yes gene_type:complete